MSEEQQIRDKTRDRYDTEFSRGWIITDEGPGKGFASYPWVLDKYEKALDLSPAESWLLHRMLKHSWESKGLVWISLHKVTREAKISRRTLDGLIKSLLYKGYIDEVGRKPPGDNRAIYDISGVFLTLTYAIKCDPSSKYSEQYGVNTMGDFFNNPPEKFYTYTTPAEINRWTHVKNQRFNWCNGQYEDWREERTEREYKIECWDCGNGFIARAANAKYCPDCKEARRQAQWLEFQAKYDAFAETITDEQVTEPLP